MTSFSTDTKEIRRFGGVAFVAFGCLSALGIWRDRAIPTFLFGFLAILGLGFVTMPVRLQRVYTGWLKISHVVGRVLTVVMLTLSYYLVITPSAFIKRLIGGRPLPFKPDGRVSSYWVVRPEPAQPKERFIKRY